MIDWSLRRKVRKGGSKTMMIWDNFRNSDGMIILHVVYVSALDGANQIILFSHDIFQADSMHQKSPYYDYFGEFQPIPVL